MSATTDDPWADLYTELEVENAAKAAVPPPLPPEPDEEDDDEEDGPDEEEGTVVGEAPLAEGEAPRKRRRRRRRRKGARADGEPAAEGETVAVADGEEPAAEADEPAVPADASRDVISNWNVPSWSEIVAGLHRPG